MSMNAMKRVLGLILTIVLLIGNISGVVFAAEDNTIKSMMESVVTTETVQDPVPSTEPPVLTATSTECVAEEDTSVSDGGEPEDLGKYQEDDIFPMPIQISEETSAEEIEERFAVYAWAMLHGEELPQTYGVLGRNRLNDLEQYVYDQLFAVATSILSGNSNSVYHVVDFDDIGANISDLPQERLKVVFDMLEYDHPYELYWFSAGTYVYLDNQNELRLWLIPAAPYKPDDFEWYTNPTVYLYDAERARMAGDNARKIVSEYAKYADYYKIGAYVDKICELVTYDHGAADNGTYAEDINPWRLINVFDNDPETNIVCQGYAKAVQYLFDISEFRNDVECYYVVGTLDGSGHAWNIVRIAGESYFLDVTGCDVCAQPHRGAYFLKAPPGSVSSGYQVVNSLYAYNESTLKIWGAGADSILNLAETDCYPEQWAVTMTQAELEAELMYASGTYWLDKHVTLVSDLVLRDIELTIAPGGRLEIASGVTLTLDDGAIINLNRDALVIVEEGGELTPIDKVHYNGGTLQSTTAGLCGDHVYWQFDSSTGTLHLYGAGQIFDYTMWQDYPWATLVNDDKIWKLVVHDGITQIGSWAFYKAVSLEEVVLPDSVTQIGEGAFSSCLNIQPFALPNKLEIIGKDAFWNCNGLDNIVIPASVESIGEAAFRYCFGLKHITFLGDAPQFIKIGEAYTNFGSVVASVNYPVENTSWTDAVRQDYGGTLTWVTDCIMGHIECVIPEQKATCTTTGLTEGKYCAVCNEVLVAQIEISVKGHTEVIDKAVAPTCVTAGLTEGKHCSACNEVLVPQKEIAFKGHSWDGGKVTMEPTEKAEGQRIFTCTVCGETRTESIPMLEHVHQYEAVVTDPVCTEMGYTTHTCSCGDSYVDTYVDALGHDMGEWETTKEVTCTENGEKQSDCSRCDHFETETIETTGHKYESVVTAPTCTEQGYTTHTCSCGDSYVDSYVDPLPMPEAEVAVARMILGNELAMQFAFPKDKIAEGVEYVVSVTKTYADGREDKNILVPMDQWGTSGSYCYVSFNGIAAKEMGDTINAQILTADGATVGGVYVDSIREYALRQLRKTTDAKTRTLYVDMLNYGAAAQTYFKYDAENLVTDELTETEKGYGTQSVKLENNLVKGPGYGASQLNLASSIQLRVKFNGIDSSMYAIVKFTNHMGREVEARVEGSEFMYSGTVVVIDQVVAADYDRDVTITVYDANGTEVANAVESVASYIARMSGGAEIYSAVAKYCAAAYGYLHR